MYQMGKEIKFDHYQKKALCCHFLLSKILNKTIFNDIHQVLQFVLFENQITSAQNCKIISVVVFKKKLLLICFLIILWTLKIVLKEALGFFMTISIISKTLRVTLQHTSTHTFKS